MRTLFEIGEEIVCVDAYFSLGGPVPIKEGNHYFVKGFINCRCGSVGVDVGIQNHANENRMVCTICNREMDSGTWPFKQTRFVPISHVENVSELVEEINNEITCLST